MPALKSGFYHAKKRSEAAFGVKPFLFSGNCLGHAFSLTLSYKKSRKGWYFVINHDLPKGCQTRIVLKLYEGSTVFTSSPRNSVDYSQTKESNGLQLYLVSDEYSHLLFCMCHCQQKSERHFYNHDRISWRR